LRPPFALGKNRRVSAHPVFPDIQLHSDEELAEALGAGIAERQTVHEWPLSCVQRLVLDDGTRLAYKSQLPPTVEAAFYERASSPLLPGGRPLGNLGACQTLAIDWIDAPSLRDVARDDAQLVAYGRRVLTQIGAIRGDLPVYLDVGSAGAWSAAAEVTLDKLRHLIRDRRFGLVDVDTAERVAAWTASGEVLARVADGSRVTHGDLKADQVFVTGDGYRVIDWQRPVVAPPEVDLVSLLVGERMSPRRFVDSTVVAIFWFLRLHWAVQAQFDLFPEFRGPLFDQWSAQAVRFLLR
jgi:hypothetical protein